MWSFVGSKANLRWLWYLLERRSDIILAYHLGGRTDESLKALLAKVAHLPIRICATDDWGAYSRQLPGEYIHQAGKANTWKIERRNLNLRTHIKRLNRKTICFSRSKEIHDNVIGLYINKHYFISGFLMPGQLNNTFQALPVHRSAPVLLMLYYAFVLILSLSEPIVVSD